MLLKQLGKAITDSPVSKTYRTNQFNLSMRDCPDHIGTQCQRIADSVFLCPIDKKTYNYTEGFTLENGDKVPGGAVENQGNFDHIDHFTMFENRSDRLAKNE